MTKILVIDDELEICKQISLILSKQGYEVTYANSYKEFADLEQRNFDYDVVLVDLWLKNSTKQGIDIIEYLKNKYENLVIVSFPAKEGMLENLKETLKAALPDTRSFDGCISVVTYIEDASNTIHLIEDWESLEHKAKYLNWRVETGLLDILEPLLEGGASGLKATICGEPHHDI